MRLQEILQTSRRVAETRGRNAKIAALAELLRRVPPDEIETAVAFLSGEIPGGRIGLGPAMIYAARPNAAGDSSLEIGEVRSAFDAIRSAQGGGSSEARRRILSALFSRATAEEQEFLARLVLGELRQGALEGIMLEAIAAAADLSPAEIRRAAMLAGDVPAVARAALVDGRSGLARFKLALFRPLQPMLAQTVDDVPAALEELGRAALEFKLDGARVQVHKSGDDVRIFTRNLRDVTGSLPEVVELVRALRSREAVLDGEAIALRTDGRPQPFQVTMRRIGRKLDVEASRGELPLSAFFFDLVYRDGEELFDRPAAERFDALADALPAELVIPRIVTSDEAEARSFLARALEQGHEGIMAKALDAPYEAGRRGSAWLKLKQARTLDLVVLAAEWGHGRRRGWLSNLHLGARDSASGGFVMLGKTFKGLTDELLAFQTKELLAREIGRDETTVYVRPELVVEIAFNDIQASPHYPGGLALRFARVKRYRPDKRAEDADTIETVRAIHRGEPRT